MFGNWLVILKLEVVVLSFAGVDVCFLDFLPKPHLVACFTLFQHGPAGSITNPGKVSSKFVGKKNIHQPEGTMNCLPGRYFFIAVFVVLALVPIDEAPVCLLVGVTLNEALDHVTLLHILYSLHRQPAADGPELL